MNILAFETSSFACSVALQNGDHVELRHEVVPMQQAQRILSTIKEVLDVCSLTVNDLDAVAYGNGPGSFTGIRIANTVAQGLGFAANLPLIQISSLAALAQTAFIEQQKTHLLVSLDARMDQVYWAQYQIDQSDSGSRASARDDGLAELIGKERLCVPGEVKIEKIAVDTKWFAVGDGWEKYGTELIESLGFQPEMLTSPLFPTAEAVLQLAIPKLNKKEWVEASAAIPAYLR